MVAFSLAFPCLLFLRYRWAVRLVQGILLLGSVEWIRTLCVLTADRQRAGEPWIRMAVILGSVALGTGGSVLVFRSRSLRKRYALAHDA